jgi:hypothetical protein
MNIHNPCDTCEFMNGMEGDGSCERCSYYRLWWAGSLLHSWRNNWEDNVPVGEYADEILKVFYECEKPYAVKSQGKPRDIPEPMDLMKDHNDDLVKGIDY